MERYTTFISQKQDAEVEWNNEIEYAGGLWKRNTETGEWEYSMLPETASSTAAIGESSSSSSTLIFGLRNTCTLLYFALAINGILAFLLNFVSFTANKRTSALSMTVAGNVKQAMSIGLSVVLFSYVITYINGLGILVTLVGGAWYR